MQNSEFYKERQNRIISYLKENDISLAVIEDTENRRDSSVRYLTGMPSDALLFLFASGKTIISPWDVNLANQHAVVDEILPYKEFGRNLASAIPEIMVLNKIGGESRIELTSAIPYTLFMEIKEKLPETEIICIDNGIDNIIKKYRSIKDAEEIVIMKKAFNITNDIITSIEKKFSINAFKTELDIAMFIEIEARKQGAEGTGFDTLVAGPERSFAIHAFPSFSNNSINLNGLTIIDFGINYGGYTSDITMTIAINPSKQQEEYLNHVEKAYNLALKAISPGITSSFIAKTVDDYFSKHNLFMPHSLGHGIGLEAHEYPLIRNIKNKKDLIEPGMIITIEPGLYSPEIGGVRLENDILITEKDIEILTRSRILKYP